MNGGFSDASKSRTVHCPGIYEQLRSGMVARSSRAPAGYTFGGCARECGVERYNVAAVTLALICPDHPIRLSSESLVCETLTDFPRANCPSDAPADTGIPCPSTTGSGPRR